MKTIKLIILIGLASLTLSATETMTSNMSKPECQNHQAKLRDLYRESRALSSEYGRESDYVETVEKTITHAKIQAWRANCYNTKSISILTKEEIYEDQIFPHMPTEMTTLQMCQIVDEFIDGFVNEKHPETIKEIDVATLVTLDNDNFIPYECQRILGWSDIKRLKLKKQIEINFNIWRKTKEETNEKLTN